MTITFIGHGYVGLVSAAVFADLGNTVWVIGHTQEKIDNLNKGILPIYEPGLEEIVKRNLAANRIKFTLSYDESVSQSDVVFIAVGTPSAENGEANLTTVYEVAKNIAEKLQKYMVVVTKSTVPVGTNKKIKELIKSTQPSADFSIASAPEFLREGQAISDTLHPDRVVIGTEDKKAEEVLVELHRPIGAPMVLTTIETAEMIKYASNSLLATKISFANAIAQMSERVGADGLAVLQAVGMDKRIGPLFLSPGAGYGGSCFPKDVKALIAIAKDNGYDFALLKAVEQINYDAINHIVNKAKNMLQNEVEGKTVAVLGVAFKPNTDDMRDAPSIPIVKALQNAGAKIQAYDPIASENAKKILHGVAFANSVLQAVEGADLAIVMTEWNEFMELNLYQLKQAMKTPAILDARNIYEPEKVRGLGFEYQGVGR